MSKFLNAIAGCNFESPPVFMMRQAGRYHSHYRKIKERNTFEEICKNPKIAAEVALGPVETFGFDAGILFSDILFILEMVGYNIKFNPGPIITKGNAKPISAMNFQAEAIPETKKLLGKTPLIGFVGGLATIHHFLTVSNNCKKEHQNLEDFIKQIRQLYIANILLQINAGVDCIAVFDSKAANLDDSYWQNVQNIIDEIKTTIPIIYYGKQTLDHTKLTGISCFGYSSQYNMSQVLSNSTGASSYGNFDETILTQTYEVCKKKIDEYLENIIKNTSNVVRQSWVASLGHGIPKDAFEQNIIYFIKAVQQLV